ncbi:MAG TPA: PHP domain-containing protein [Bacteroidales bacterium]|nr:PHP domain-containing protein [Bacteroidales bacterium]
MITLRSDLHIHTLLSPCGDLDMTPAAIVQRAIEKGLHLIGITDHNSTRQAMLVKELGAEQGLYVLCGAEINTREEVHCLTFFDEESAISEFQDFIDKNLSDIENDPLRFGHQVQVDREENIVYIEKKLLITALHAGIDEIETEVHRLGGLFIPAHVDRTRFSLISQLGFIPADLRADALEISAANCHPEALAPYRIMFPGAFITGSDAHYSHQIGNHYTEFTIKDISLAEITMALKNQGGRFIKKLL